MATTKIKIGEIPIGRGEWNASVEYYKENTVTLYDMSFRAKQKVSKGVAPAVIGSDGKVALRNTDVWELMSGNPATYNTANDVEKLSHKVDNIKPIIINGNVTNAPDEEDITFDGNNLLKLKNRSAGNGMGYVILRTGKTFAEQVTQPNTIYEIRYDFDLGGAEVEIPENCVLKFEGGSLRNGTLIGNDTKLRAELSLIFINVIIQGTWNVFDIHMSWFDFVQGSEQTIIDNRTNFKNLIALTSEHLVNNIYFIDGVFWSSMLDTEANNAESVFQVKSNTSLHLGYCTIRIIPHRYNYKNVILVANAHNVHIYNGHIIGDAVAHDYDTTIHETHEQNHGIKIGGNTNNIVIEGTKVEQMTGDGIDIISDANTIEYVYIRNVVSDKNNRQGISIEVGKNIFINDSTFSNTGTIRNTAPSAGIDIEPFVKGIVINNIHIDNCRFLGNQSESLLIQPNLQEDDTSLIVNDISVRNCITDGRIAVFYFNTITIENLKQSGETADLLQHGKNLKLSNVDSFFRLEIYDIDGLHFNNVNITRLDSNMSRPVNNLTFESCTISDYECKIPSIINNCNFNRLAISSSSTITGCQIENLVEYAMARSVYTANTISKTEDLSLYSQLFKDNIFYMSKSILLKSECIMESNKLIFTGEKQENQEYTAIYASASGQAFTFINNTIEGYDSLVGRNYGNEIINVLSDKPIKIIRKEIGTFNPLNGCRELYKGGERVYNNGAWEYQLKAIVVSNRPSSPFAGMSILDTSLNKPIWWNGTSWVDATGATV